MLEGIDGSGKTSLARGLAQELEQRGFEVILTKEPTDGPIGRRIREVAASGREGISAEEEFELFHEDRRIHVAEVVRPALARGAVVIQDRSYFSTVAYQGERGLDREMLMKKSEQVAPKPDVLLLVDVPVTVALSRIKASRDAADDFETAESLERVRAAFMAMSPKTLIDGACEPERVLGAALAAILAHPHFSMT